MEAMDLNDDGQNDVMDEDIEDHEVQKFQRLTKVHNQNDFSLVVVSRCWKKFIIIGGKLPDGKTNIRCNLCKKIYCLNLSRNGTSSLICHMKVCLKSAGTHRTSQKVDMMMFREMITMAIIKYDLPYKFVEYKRIGLIFFLC